MATQSDPVSEDFSDEQLFARSISGDAQAFAEVFDRHGDAVLTHCARRIGSRTDAEDLAGSVFLEAWRCQARARFVEGSVLPWLYVVANHIAWKRIRSLVRERDRVLRTQTADVEPDHADGTVERVDLQRQAAQLSRCIDQLSVRHRAVVSLCDLGELTYAQAASALGVPEGTVRSRLSRAHERLRQLMNEPLSVAADHTTRTPSVKEIA